jgi:predicted nucleotidyltransferase
MTAPSGDDPVRARLKRVARALGPLAQRVVLIGGSIAPLLHTESLVRRPRPTDDVDGVIDAESYVAQGALQDELRAVGITEAMGVGKLAHRWRTPDGDLVDLVPTGAQLGSTGQEWDVLALREFDVLEIVPGVLLRHVRAPVLLAMKLAAFRDRGRDDPLYSSDLEDIFALVLCRPTIVDEIRASDPTVVAFVSSQVALLLTEFEIEDLAAAHLNNAYAPAEAMKIVIGRLRAMGKLRGTNDSA